MAKVAIYDLGRPDLVQDVWLAKIPAGWKNRNENVGEEVRSRAREAVNEDFQSLPKTVALIE